MRICLIGICGGEHDEGMTNTCYYLAKELSKNHDVLLLNGRSVFSKKFWKDIKIFNPHIIHYVSGPTPISFIIVKVLALYCKNTKTVMSAIHPHLRGFSRKIIPLFKPDLILTQSYETERMFVDSGCRVRFLPSGVDVEKFVPVSDNAKAKLREKYGIDKEKFVILHVGNVRKGRNIQVLKNLSGKNTQVIIIGSTSVSMERKLYQELQKKCLLRTKYFENIEEIYSLSDCYVFPVPPMNKLNCIELPLSIMEAMACNLPVITTKFGGLTRVFKAGDGLIFVDNVSDIPEAVKIIKSGTIEVKIREKVLANSWENVVMRLEDIYEELMDGANK